MEREAGDAAMRAQRLLDLREAWRARYLQERAGSNLLAATDYLLAQPIVTASQLQAALGVVNRSAQLIVDRLLRDGVLVEVTGRQRGRVYVARPVLDLLELDQDSEPQEPGASVIQTITE